MNLWTPSARLVEIPGSSSRQFTKWTLDQMAAFAVAGVRQLPLIHFSRQVALHGAADRDVEGQAQACLDWVRSNIRYVWDPYGVELVQEPLETLRVGCGDCDDLGNLLATMCACVGIPGAFRAIASQPGPFDHVYPLLELGGRWLAADPTVLGAPLGWEAPHVARMDVIPRW